MDEPATGPAPQPAQQPERLDYKVAHAVVPGPDGQPWVMLQLELNAIAIQAMKFPAGAVPQIIELIVTNLQQGAAEAAMRTGIVQAPAGALNQLPPLPSNGKLLRP